MGNLILLLFIAVATAGTEAIRVAQYGTVPQTVSPAGEDGPSPSEEFQFYEQLTDGYHLHWKSNATHITFEVIVKTTGWVGFGISPKGAMKSSDIVIGWIKDGNVHFADRHAEGRYLPAKDSSQDWHLLMGQEVNEYTVMKMVRRLDTCDEEGDLPISEGTTRVIFAYNPTDPPSDDAISYHGSNNRGTKSILLRQPPKYEQGKDPLPSDVEILEFRHENFSVPSSDTTYHCTFWKIPDLGGKRHVIRYEPIIQAGHEAFLHHSLLWYCQGGLNEAIISRDSFSCYRGRQPQANRCTHVFVSWAIGGKAFDYPSHVGYSLGTANDPSYFMMEIHYDNPTMRNDLVDSSGLRIYMTSALRQHDAGILLAGIQVGRSQIIPPYEEDFMSKGFCREDCLAEVLGDNEMYVIANMLHSHLLGTRIRTRHFREGKELPPIQEDNNYDFDYQETRTLETERIIKKGDSLLVECEYDSTGRTDPTYGGFSSIEEMCLSFITYYPRNRLSKCYSRLSYDVPSIYNDKNTWLNKTARESFKQLVASADHLQICQADQGFLMSNYKSFTPPNIIGVYTKPSTCQGDGDSGREGDDGKEKDPEKEGESGKEGDPGNQGDLREEEGLRKENGPGIGSKLTTSKTTILCYFVFIILFYYLHRHL